MTTSYQMDGSDCSFSSPFARFSSRQHSKNPKSDQEEDGSKRASRLLFRTISSHQAAVRQKRATIYSSVARRAVFTVSSFAIAIVHAPSGQKLYTQERHSLCPDFFGERGGYLATPRQPPNSPKKRDIHSLYTGFPPLYIHVHSVCDCMQMSFKVAGQN